jgi:hypothetical protein
VCLTQCPDQYYNKLTSGATMNNICAGCTENCATCIGEGSLNCITCITSAYLAINTTICNTTCPLGQYVPASGGGNVCKLCPANCANCTSATTCTTCF